MELSAFTTKLLEALEKCNVSTGAERRCPDGPQGQPNRDLVRAFEEALNRPDTSPEVQGCSAPLSPDVPGAEGEHVAPPAGILSLLPSVPEPHSAVPCGSRRPHGRSQGATV